jgi:hypothetical protein
MDETQWRGREKVLQTLGERNGGARERGRRQRWAAPFKGGRDGEQRRGGSGPRASTRREEGEGLAAGKTCGQRSVRRPLPCYAKKQGRREFGSVGRCGLAGVGLVQRTMPFFIYSKKIKSILIDSITVAFPKSEIFK